jgi:hypothetical protein
MTDKGNYDNWVDIESTYLIKYNPRHFIAQLDSKFVEGFRNITDKNGSKLFKRTTIISPNSAFYFNKFEQHIKTNNKDCGTNPNRTGRQLTTGDVRGFLTTKNYKRCYES